MANHEHKGHGSKHDPELRSGNITVMFEVSFYIKPGDKVNPRRMVEAAIIPLLKREYPGLSVKICGKA